MGQGTGTNRPKTYTQPATTPTNQPTTADTPHHQNTTTQQQNKVTANIATGKRPDPSRTRKVSLPAPMILPNPGGKVGHRRTQIEALCPPILLGGKGISTTGPYRSWRPAEDLTQHPAEISCRRVREFVGAPGDEFVGTYQQRPVGGESRGGS